MRRAPGPARVRRRPRSSSANRGAARARAGGCAHPAAAGAGRAMGTVPSALKHCLSYQHLLKEQLWIAEPPAAAHPAQVPPGAAQGMDGTRSALRGAAATRGRTGRRRPLAAPWPLRAVPCAAAAPARRQCPALSAVRSSGEGGRPFPPGPRRRAVPGQGVSTWPGLRRVPAVRTQVGGAGGGEAAANPPSSRPRHA